MAARTQKTRAVSGEEKRIGNVERYTARLNVKFEELFEGASWPEAKERIGVMSVDSLNRNWKPVGEEQGYLVAKAKDCRAALVGRMCKREDGKLCIEVVVRAVIRNDKLCHFEFWHLDLADASRHVKRLQEVMTQSPPKP
jgi:hypothetical protein